MPIHKSLKVRALFIVLQVIASIATAQADAVDEFVLAQMKTSHIPGVAIAVVKDGKPVKVRGYGVANLELGAPVTADSVFFVGSLSKQIIAVAVMKLVQDGRLSLDDTAVRFLDGAPGTWNDITIRHLLTHTAGLPNEAPGYNRLRPQSDAEVIKSAYGVPLAFMAGEKWQYSNLGYFVLAEVVAKVSGQPWPTFVRERIFTPLRMNASGVIDAETVVPHRANGYEYRDGRYQNAATILALRPSGAFKSSLNDMLKWDASLTNSTILRKETLLAMWTAVGLRGGAAYPYGFGFQVESYGSHRAISHGGSLTGFRSWYLRLPDDRLSVLVLTNSDNASADVIATRIASEYVKDLFPKRQFAPLSTAQLDALAGSYRLATGRLVLFARNGRGLLMNAPGGFEVFLLPSSPRVFFSPDDPRVHFEFDRVEATWRMTRYINGETRNVAMKE